MRNGIPGKCVSIHNCLSHCLDSEILDYAPINSFRVKEPIVCCTDCTFNDTRNFFINPNVGIIHKTGQKVQDKCVEYIHKLDYSCKDNDHANMVRLFNPDKNCYDVKVKINTVISAVGGVDAYRGEFPHMGDSGGPLQTFFDNHVDYLVKNCVYNVIGVTSYGRQCGFAPSIGIYTRVIHYVSWIESIVWP